ncbi:cysteine desulfurase, putative [Entamoeba histolytica HM-1:IMSS-B]|uniref:cysteine desulfurase n=9 Tax=Entamoeba TaxID=5758 RepID=A0A8U0WPM8_ENTH1|nr:cysteine desulfurase, putative [Entamoeba nuttalli P19]XP_655257.1 cysteine desulfurase, putative [Entamoeba histolytica HM-1:IMSS]AAQ18492.1 iron-sulphur cluster assembly protein [Entamoeba histolytica]EMD49609.1 FeS cluster assembly protein, putative [Entamoeba histolytica KU27]EMH76159.1 cysteine desulfurase, putative [Entamoeba histolytica HM-1:IMSS-B]EMS15170.1 iron-sulfur cluster assembly protein, putative [Entamoeba histolytica HM-3:IMSS]ENY62411.1 iron-sulfur cluster assembly prote|eukprot:XP_008856753.1 cysteine desulfurase, putative [Entamoeba nuttalli P19]
MQSTKSVYLDNNATTMVDPEVLNSMLPYFSEIYGNPNSLHAFGQKARKALSDSLDIIYECIGASDDDTVLITANSTEGNNTVLKTMLARYETMKGRNKIIVSQIEHPSISESEKYLKERGIEVIKMPVNEDGVVDPKDLERLIDDKTALVSCMWVNNETGLIMPVEELCKIAHDHGALFHSDATQAMGKIKVSVKDVPVDYLTFTAHKFHGPKGVGALFIRAGKPITPLLHGGEQMGGLRSGTIDTPSVVGMAVALKKATHDINIENTYVRKLRDKLEAALRTIPDVTIVGKPELRVPNTILVAFKGVEGEAMLWDLNKHGIAASTGSACASESLQANPTFKAMKFGEDLSHTGIRLSLSRFNTEEEIDYTIDIIKKSVDRLRQLSSTYA